MPIEMSDDENERPKRLSLRERMALREQQVDSSVRTSKINRVPRENKLKEFRKSRDLDDEESESTKRRVVRYGDDGEVDITVRDRNFKNGEKENVLMEISRANETKQAITEDNEVEEEKIDANNNKSVNQRTASNNDQVRHDYALNTEEYRPSSRNRRTRRTATEEDEISTRNSTSRNRNRPDRITNEISTKVDLRKETSKPLTADKSKISLENSQCNGEVSAHGTVDIKSNEVDIEPATSGIDSNIKNKCNSDKTHKEDTLQQKKDTDGNDSMRTDMKKTSISDKRPQETFSVKLNSNALVDSKGKERQSDSGEKPKTNRNSWVKDNKTASIRDRFQTASKDQQREPFGTKARRPVSVGNKKSIFEVGASNGEANRPKSAIFEQKAELKSARNENAERGNTVIVEEQIYEKHEVTVESAHLPKRGQEVVIDNHIKQETGKRSPVQRDKPPTALKPTRPQATRKETSDSTKMKKDFNSPKSATFQVKTGTKTGKPESKFTVEEKVYEVTETVVESVQIPKEELETSKNVPNHETSKESKETVSGKRNDQANNTSRKSSNGPNVPPKLETKSRPNNRPKSVIDFKSRFETKPTENLRSTRTPSNSNSRTRNQNNRTLPADKSKTSDAVDVEVTVVSKDNTTEEKGKTTSEKSLAEVKTSRESYERKGRPALVNDSKSNFVERRTKESNPGFKSVESNESRGKVKPDAEQTPNVQATVTKNVAMNNQDEVKTVETKNNGKVAQTAETNSVSGRYVRRTVQVEIATDKEKGSTTKDMDAILRDKKRQQEAAKKQAKLPKGKNAFKAQLEANAPKTVTVNTGGGMNKANSNIEKLLKWIAKRINQYPAVSVTNFTSSWENGIALCALMNYLLGDKVLDPLSVSPTDKKKNFEMALKAATNAGVPALLDADELATCEIDRRSMITYLHLVYKVLFADKQTQN